MDSSQNFESSSSPFPQPQEEPDTTPSVSVWEKLNLSGPELPAIPANLQWESCSDAEKFLRVLGDLNTPFANFLAKEFGAYRHTLKTFNGVVYEDYNEYTEWDLWLSVRNKIARPPQIHPLSDTTIQEVIRHAEQHVEQLCVALRNADELLDKPGSRDIVRVTEDKTWDNGYVYSTARQIMVQLIHRCVIGFCNRHQRDEAKNDDMNLNCLARLHAVLETLRKAKTACRDALQEHSRIEMLVHAPLAIWKEKLRQKNTNDSKAATAEKNKQAAARLKEIEGQNGGSSTIPTSQQDASSAVSTFQQDVPSTIPTSENAEQTTRASPKKKRPLRASVAPQTPKVGTTQAAATPQHPASSPPQPPRLGMSQNQAVSKTLQQPTNVPQPTSLETNHVQAGLNTQHQPNMRQSQPTLSLADLKASVASAPKQTGMTGMVRQDEGRHIYVTATPEMLQDAEQPAQQTSFSSIGLSHAPQVASDTAPAGQTATRKRPRGEDESLPAPKMAKVGKAPQKPSPTRKVSSNLKITGGAAVRRKKITGPVKERHDRADRVAGPSNFAAPTDNNVASDDVEMSNNGPSEGALEQVQETYSDQALTHTEEQVPYVTSSTEFGHLQDQYQGDTSQPTTGYGPVTPELEHTGWTAQQEQADPITDAFTQLLEPDWPSNLDPALQEAILGTNDATSQSPVEATVSPQIDFDTLAQETLAPFGDDPERVFEEFLQENEAIMAGNPREQSGSSAQSEEGSDDSLTEAITQALEEEEGSDKVQTPEKEDQDDDDDFEELFGPSP